MVYNTRKYGALLADTLPGVIDSQEEYARHEEIFNRLISKGEENLSPEETKLFELLANLMEDYEARTLEPLPDLTPLEVLQHLIKSNNLKQHDLADIFGTQSVVSEVLSGKRQLTKQQIKKLSARFKLRIEAFI